MIFAVAPFAGAWIEIRKPYYNINCPWLVAPFAGAWIEIGYLVVDSYAGQPSLPSRERGLKSECGLKAQHGNGRSLRGSVD